jgi:hypothetical protein
MAGIGTDIREIASSASNYNQLSADLTNDIEQVARSIVTMQEQPSVALQNQRGLDLLTVKKGGFCLLAIFIFGAWVYAIMRFTTPTLFAN